MGPDMPIPANSLIRSVSPLAFPFSPTLGVANMREQGQILQTLASSEVFFPIALLVCGTLLLFWGFKAYRWVVVCNCVALGWYWGSALGARAQIATLGAILGAVLLGAICWPLMKYAVAVCGGTVGALVGMSMWAYFGQPDSERWAGAMIGLITLGLFSFILFKASVIVFSCVQGAIMAVLGASAMLMRFTPWNHTIYSTIDSRPIVMPVLVASVALLGILMQHQRHGLLDGGSGGHGGAGGGEKKAEKK
jgi:hypothetical protein